MFQVLKWWSGQYEHTRNSPGKEKAREPMRTQETIHISVLSCCWGCDQCLQDRGGLSKTGLDSVFTKHPELTFSLQTAVREEPVY